MLCLQKEKKKDKSSHDNDSSDDDNVALSKLKDKMKCANKKRGRQSKDSERGGKKVRHMHAVHQTYGLYTAPVLWAMYCTPIIRPGCTLYTNHTGPMYCALILNYDNLI